MRVVISNKSDLSTAPSRISISNNNKVGRVSFSADSKTRVALSNNNRVGKVTFNKIARIEDTVGLVDLFDVVTAGQQDGDVLVYQANTTTYNIKTLPKIDGGMF